MLILNKKKIIYSILFYFIWNTFEKLINLHSASLNINQINFFQHRTIRASCIFETIQFSYEKALLLQYWEATQYLPYNQILRSA